jgi:hypothetical protein
MRGDDGCPETYEPSTELEQLHHAGWSVGVSAAVTTPGHLVWLVTGHNGENLIRAEGATEADAWHGAVG